MLRILGALLIAGASLTLGLSYVAAESRKLDDLNSILLLLKDMRGELGTRVTPLPQLLEQMKERRGGAAGLFVRNLCSLMGELGEKKFALLWAEGIEKSLGNLDREEREILDSLGHSLGRYELDRQLSELDICIDSLENRIALRSRSLPEKRRLGIGMACSLGALLLIVLV